MAERDPFLHLQWGDIDFQQFIENTADMLAETTWSENCIYPPDVTTTQALYMKIAGYDAGLEAAVALRPTTTDFEEWKTYYLFVCYCRLGPMTLNI